MSANIPQMAENALDHVPTCTPEQNADARRYVERQAPDLVSVIFGSES